MEKVSDFNDPFVLGAPKSDYVKDGLGMLNFIRYLAGLPDDIELDADLGYKAQALTAVNAMNGVQSHTPGRPAGVPKDVYETAYPAGPRCNLQMSISEGSFSEKGARENLERRGPYHKLAEFRRYYLSRSVLDLVSDAEGPLAAVFVGLAADEAPDSGFMAAARSASAFASADRAERPAARAAVASTAALLPRPMLSPSGAFAASPAAAALESIDSNTNAIQVRFMTLMPALPAFGIKSTRFPPRRQYSIPTFGRLTFPREETSSRRGRSSSHWTSRANRRNR